MLSVDARDCGRRLLRDDDAAAVEFDRRLAPTIVTVDEPKGTGKMASAPVSKLNERAFAMMIGPLRSTDNTIAKVVGDVHDSQRRHTHEADVVQPRGGSQRTVSRVLEGVTGGIDRTSAS